MALLDALKREIADGPKPLIVCRAGVSKAANPNAPDWRALIESGIERVVAYKLADATWGDRQRQALKGDASEWIGAADQVTDKLGGEKHAELADLKPINTELLGALKELAQVGCLSRRRTTTVSSAKRSIWRSFRGLTIPRFFST